MEGLEEDIEVIRANVRLEHIHLIVVIPPRVSVAEVVGYIKSQSGKKLKARFSFFINSEEERILSNPGCLNSLCAAAVGVGIIHR